MTRTHLPCPDCGSSDGLADYGTHQYCFVCQERTSVLDTEHNNKNKKEKAITTPQDNFFSKAPESEPSLKTYSPAVGERPFGPTPVDPDRIVSLSDRGITKDSARRYSVWVNPNGEHVYPYYRDGKHVANKFRSVKDKGFLVQGEINRSGLFGQQTFEPGSAKQVTILEGELDALSAYQMFGMKWPCVSVKSASSAQKDVADNFEYLNSFEQIVVCFDKDEAKKRPDGTVYYPGQDAAQKVAGMFELGKVRVLTLRDAKDANDYLMKGWIDRFQKEWWNAPSWTPAGLKHAKDLWEDIIAPKNFETVLYPWDGLNNLTYGLRLSELVLLTADTGVGKTSIVKEIEHHLLNNTERGVGILHLEEPNSDTILGLMSITCNKPLHLPDIREKVSEEDMKKYFSKVTETDKIIVWDHFGSNSIQSVLDTIRHMVALGCRYIVLDHLSIVVSDQSGDERKQLDEISTKLKTLCMETNSCVIAIIHINRKGQVRGSAGPEQVANIVIRLDRNKLSDDDEIRNTTKVIVEKNRFCGRTGLACYLRYDGETGRLTELPQDAWKELKEIEDKNKKREDEW